MYQHYTGLCVGFSIIENKKFLCVVAEWVYLFICDSNKFYLPQWGIQNLRRQEEMVVYAYKVNELFLLTLLVY